MNTSKSASVSPLADSQMVIIIARWVLVVASLFLILADPKSVPFNVTRFEIFVVLLLAVSNFYLVAQVITKRKTLDLVIYGMSVADLIVITGVIIAQGGFGSNVYTYYFPAMLAFSLAFPMLELYLYLTATVGLYSIICLFTLQTTDDIQTLLIRVLMLIAIAVCGNHFAQLERNRRSAILRAQFGAQPAEEPQSAVAAPVTTARPLV